mgnify:CR=1 FL=1
MKADRLVGHQGDVGFWLASTIPSKRMAIAPLGSRLIVARGEATGHHHSFPSRDVKLYEAEPGVPFEIEMPDGTLADALFARVLQDAPLEHQEHSTVIVPKQDYWIVMPREYTPNAIVRSVD